MADDAGANRLSKAVKAQIDAFQDLLDADPRTPSSYKRDAPIWPGPTYVPVERYISREFHELEKEKLWSRVWQMACHEDDIPKVGDYIPYDIVDKSYLIVRTGPDEFKAYYNACLHRGRKLREYPGSGAKELRCQFHGWTWSLEGKLMQVPCLWDFPGLKREEQALPEVKVGRWGKFVFINPDPNCEPFEDFIGDLSSQFELLPYEKRYVEAHVSKLIRCNWKVAQEAFSESYHVIATHPQGIDSEYGELEGKYDVFGNYTRAIRIGTLEGTAAPVWEPLPQDGIRRSRHPLSGEVYESMGDGRVKVTTTKGDTGVYTWRGEHVEGNLGDVSLHMLNLVGGPQLSLEAETTGVGGTRMAATRMSVNSRVNTGDPRAALKAMASIQREQFREIVPSIADKIADIELTAVYLTLFPNFHPWGSFNRIVYRFRPNGDNHEECLMECYFLAPVPENKPQPPNAPVHALGFDDDWVEAPELGTLGKVFNQDIANMQWVQAGMHATKRTHLQLADYNETKLRHFHKLLDEWIAKP